MFSSLDHGGRYACGNQPAVSQWNLARLGETLLPLLDPQTGRRGGGGHRRAAVVPERYGEHFSRGMRAKLGLAERHGDDPGLIYDLLALLHEQRVDFTSFFPSAVGVAVGPRCARGRSSQSQRRSMRGRSGGASGSRRRRQNARGRGGD